MWQVSFIMQATLGPEANIRLSFAQGWVCRSALPLAASPTAKRVSYRTLGDRVLGRRWAVSQAAAPAVPAEAVPASRSATRHLRIVDLVRPHWKGLTLAFIAVLGETVTDILEPWPIKIVVDNILQSKPMRGWMGKAVTDLFGTNTFAIINFAVAAVAIIAIVGAVSSYFEKYLTTSIGQWVGHDLRRCTSIFLAAPSPNTTNRGRRPDRA